MFCGEIVANRNAKNFHYFLQMKRYLFIDVPNSLMRKRLIKENKQTLAELTSAHGHSQAKCQQSRSNLNWLL